MTCVIVAHGSGRHRPETLAMIAVAQKGDPRRLLEAIAEVACQLN